MFVPNVFCILTNVRIDPRYQLISDPYHESLQGYWIVRVY